MRYIILSVLLLSFNSNLSAQTSGAKPTASPNVKSAIPAVENSAIPSLNEGQYNAYLKGEEMGMARAAELNNYPSPARVLNYQNQLKLSQSQINQLQAAVKSLDFKAREMGRFILQNEKKLNELFYSKKANEGNLIYFSNQIGLYQGELRNAHLQAHLKAFRLLTPDQLKKYAQIK